jgi:hypothetical protein
MHAPAALDPAIAPGHGNVHSRLVDKLQPFDEVQGDLLAVPMARQTYARAVAFGGMNCLFFDAGPSDAVPGA